MAKARPSSAEIDRFLEEVNRRKQQQARQSAPPPQVQQPPKPNAPAQAAPKTVRVQQRQVQQRQVQQRQVMEEPLVQAVIIEQMPEPIRNVAPRPAASAYQITPPATLPPRGAESAPIHHAKALLASRDGMRAVFVLNEILSPPRCLNPYGRRK
ncbi:MAG: hypothetical protein QM703_17170 [Gemmatales bacterium]